MDASRRAQSWGWAWLALSAALGLHVADEAVHNFLAVYNAAVQAINERAPVLPLPTFSFGIWIGGLTAAVLLLLPLSFFAFRDSRCLRPIAYGLALIMTVNGLLHLGSSLYYHSIMPGSYSSPLLIIAAVWLVLRLRKSASSRSGDRVTHES